MKVVEQMKTDADSKQPWMPRFGMVMQLPYDMDRSVFYGRGPVENYPDRRLSQRVGIYSLTADEQFYPYIRPQETGTKGDIRWWDQTTATGKGMHIEAAEPFYASALHYAIEDLDGPNGEKAQRHSPQVPSRSTPTSVSTVLMPVWAVSIVGAAGDSPCLVIRYLIRTAPSRSVFVGSKYAIIEKN